MGDLSLEVEIVKKYGPLIESNREVMDNIRLYSSLPVPSFEDNIPLEFLGGEINHVHYKLGMLESGLHIATRENTLVDGELQRNIYGNYARSMADLRRSGDDAVIVCCGVKIQAENDENESRYFLVVEDFTEGGRFRIEGSGKDAGHGELEWSIVNGRKVYHDSQESTLSLVSPNIMEDTFLLNYLS